MIDQRNEFSDKQKLILRRLLEKPAQQKDMQDLLHVSAPAIHYHLTQLERKQLVLKKTMVQIGAAKINEVSINPAALQRVRAILNLQVSTYTLVTGFGTLETGYRIPDIAFSLLQRVHYPVDRIVCFTSPDALQKREVHASMEHLRALDKVMTYDYNVYRHLDSPFFSEFEGILCEELKRANLVIDLTPLSKLYSFKLLEFANKFLLPCFYVGETASQESCLIWLNHLKLLVEQK